MANSMLSKYYSKGKTRLRQWLSPRKIKVKLQGDQGKEFYLFNPQFNVETEIYWQGFDNYSWEQKTRKIWSQLCINSNSIFDIGANTGIFSILAKVHHPSSTVYAFEPQPNIYQVLEKNNRINKFDIRCQNMALSNLIGSLPFYNYGSDPFGKGNTTAGSLNKEWRTNNQKQIEVAVTTLDAFIIANELKNIDLIKIDVETLEAEVLEGYKKHLHQHKAIIILEIQGTEIGEKIHGFFKDQNYFYFNINEATGLVPVKILGDDEHRNYLICHQEKLAQLQHLDNKV